MTTIQTANEQTAYQTQRFVADFDGARIETRTFIGAAAAVARAEDEADDIALFDDADAGR